MVLPRTAYFMRIISKLKLAKTFLRVYYGYDGVSVLVFCFNLSQYSLSCIYVPYSYFLLMIVYHVDDVDDTQGN